MIDKLKEFIENNTKIANEHKIRSQELIQQVAGAVAVLEALKQLVDQEEAPKQAPPDGKL